jgi:hypothetical protein
MIFSYKELDKICDLFNNHKWTDEEDQKLVEKLNITLKNLQKSAKSADGFWNIIPNNFGLEKK